MLEYVIVTGASTAYTSDICFLSMPASGGEVQQRDQQLDISTATSRQPKNLLICDLLFEQGKLAQTNRFK